MLNFMRKHPYIVGCLITFLILFLVGIFALDTTWIESLLGAAVLSVVGVVGIWWKKEGFG